MVRRLVEQQHVGMRNDGLYDRQPLAPSTGERHRLGGKIGKSRTSAYLAQPPLVLCLGYAGADERSIQHIAYGKPGRKVRLLQHISNARALARG